MSLDCCDQQPEQTDHHCVPRSFQGSNDREVNLTRLPKIEHSAFHKVSGHLPPCFLLRKMLLSSIGWHDSCGKSLPASFFSDTLLSLTPDDWRSLYVAQAFRPNGVQLPEGPNVEKDLSKSAIHMHFALWEEQQLTADGLRSLGMSTYVSRDTRQFLNQLMAYFHVDDPVRAMRIYLHDKSETGERKWTKAMKSDTYVSLRKIFANVPLDVMLLENRIATMEALIGQQRVLMERAEHWQPNVHDRIRQIAEYGQANMQKLLGGFLLRAESSADCNIGAAIDR